MSRLVSLNRSITPDAARIEWHVAADGHPLQRIEPAMLLERLGGIAAEVVERRVSTPVIAADVERLQVFEEVRAGDLLVVTAALEPARYRRHAVSVVVRKGQRVIIAGVVTFVALGEPSRSSAAQQNRARSSARDGKALVETTFHARTTGDDWLLNGNPLAWVHASAVLSAQGFIGGPADFVGLQGISRLGPVVAGEALTLQCSVVHAANDVVSVLAHVRTELERRDVLWAVTSFRARGGEVPALLRDWPHWLGVAQPGT